jgi:hypothetical protein
MKAESSPIELDALARRTGPGGTRAMRSLLLRADCGHVGSLDEMARIGAKQPARRRDPE